MESSSRIQHFNIVIYALNNLFHHYSLATAPQSTSLFTE